MKHIYSRDTFSCFSPPVMIATFIIEIGLAIWIILSRRLNLTVILGVFLLIFLAIFQLAEFGICEQLGFGGSAWARAGFASITLLPPLGIHIAHSIAGKKNNLLLLLVYGLAAIWIGLFVFGDLLMGQVCGGNYVVFNLSSSYDPYYFLYYNLLILLGLWFAANFALNATRKKVSKALRLFIVGYLAFLVPSIIVRLLNAASTGSDTALPSIMCGFAVLLALIFSFGVIPNASKKK